MEHHYLKTQNGGKAHINRRTPGFPDLSGPILKDRTLDELYEELTSLYRAPEGTPDKTKQLISDLQDPTSNRAQRLDALNRSITIFKTLVDGLRLCRHCTMRYTPNNHARYCYVTCQSGNYHQMLRPDPDSALRQAFAEPPTITILLAQVKLEEEKENT